MPTEKESTTIKVSMETHVSLEALKDEYFTKSTSFNDIIKELADFYRQNKKNMDAKLQFLQSQITGLEQKINFVAKTQEKDNEMLVGLKAKLDKLTEKPKES